MFRNISSCADYMDDVIGPRFTSFSWLTGYMKLIVILMVIIITPHYKRDTQIQQVGTFSLILVFLMPDHIKREHSEGKIWRCQVWLELSGIANVPWFQHLSFRDSTSSYKSITPTRPQEQRFIKGALNDSTKWWLKGPKIVSWYNYSIIC